MIRVPYINSDNGFVPRWYIFGGEYIYVCTCGHSMVVPFDRVKHSGEVEAGLACNACATHRFLFLDNIGVPHD